MYYIVNHTQHIIAADSNLLKLLSVANIDELYTKIALGDIKFTSSDVNVSIKVEDETLTYKREIHSLSGMLGNITLVELYPSEEDEDSSPFIIEDDEPVTIFDDKNEEPEEKISLDDEPFNLILDEDDKRDEEIKEEISDEISFDDDLFDLDDTKDDENKISFDDDIFDLISDADESKKDNEEKIEKLISFDDEPFELISDDDNSTETPKDEVIENEVEEKISFDDEPFELVSENIEEIKDEKVEVESSNNNANDTTVINLDAAKISQNIGISTDDYSTFLNEYIDTAFTLEKDLDGENDDKRLHAITTLSHLSNVLHLPMITDIIEEIRDTSSDDRNTAIKSLYATLARLSTTGESPVNNTVNIVKDIEEPKAVIEETVIDDIIETTTKDDISDDLLIEDFIKEDEITNNEKVVVEPEEDEVVVESTVNPNGFGTIDLSDVKPIHFDFQMEAAASDLSLPVELIEEFVNDFIEQAHVETKKMLKCYEEGDLDAIQKIGHLLKGTASNLRINPLADTLYEIQFCEDSSNLEKLIKEYWGHFLSFETQIKLISK